MRAMLIAFSIYSRIPMPSFIWEEKDRKRALCFFPLIGAVIGAVFIGVFKLFDHIGAGIVIRAAVMTCVPVLVTGGIHVDGFLDTCDARASYGDREKKLAILKDSNSGAFAVTGGILYFLLFFAACTELTSEAAAASPAIFVMSRALSGFGVSILPEARKKGMLADLMKDVKMKNTACAMIGYYIAALLYFLCFLGVLRALILGTAAVLVFLYYRSMALREFGGVTGDLSGYFLALCELTLFLVAAFLKYL